VQSASQVNAVAATSDVGRIYGVLFLPGVEAPSAARAPFIMRPFDQELLLCRRYFTQFGGASVAEALCIAAVVAATVSDGVLVFPSPMRAAPTLAFSAVSDWCVDNGSYIAATALSISGPTGAAFDRFTLRMTHASIAASVPVIMHANNTLNARLKLDARL
jgi:hypothetical protein